MINENSRVCFIGDSITAQNRYVVQIARYFAENAESSGIKIFNCGCSGGWTKSQSTFFEEDVLPHNPTHLFVMLGINDSGRDFLARDRTNERFALLERDYRDFVANYKVLAEKCASSGAELTLVTLPPYGEYQPVGGNVLRGGYALTLAYRDFIVGYAKEKGYSCVDVHQYITKQLQNEILFDDDRIHLNDRGHYYLAKCLLEYMGYDIGEDRPVPDYMENWCELEKRVRRIYASEAMILGLDRYRLPDAKKIEFVRHYLESGEWVSNRRTQEGNEFFYNLGLDYLKNKPIQSQLVDEINQLIENGFRDINH